MKIAKIRRIIAINLIIFIILLAALGSLMFYLYVLNDETHRHEKQTKSEISSMNAKKFQIESKVKDVKKYKKVWKSIKARKKTTRVIKIDEINEILRAQALKYNVSKPLIQMKLPTKIESGVMKKGAIDVYYTEGSLTFKAVDDASAVLFVRDFAAQMPGQLITTSIEVKKERNYNAQDLQKISKSNDIALIDVKSKFSWYSYRDKEEEKKDEVKKKLFLKRN